MTTDNGERNISYGKRETDYGDGNNEITSTVITPYNWCDGGNYMVECTSEDLSPGLLVTSWESGEVTPYCPDEPNNIVGFVVDSDLSPGNYAVSVSLSWREDLFCKNLKYYSDLNIYLISFYSIQQITDQIYLNPTEWYSSTFEGNILKKWVDYEEYGFYREQQREDNCSTHNKFHHKTIKDGLCHTCIYLHDKYTSSTPIINIKDFKILL